MKSSIIKSINLNAVENLSIQELESRLEFSFAVVDPDIAICANIFCDGILCDGIICDAVCDCVASVCDCVRSVCDAVCDEICDQICDQVCDKFL